MNDSAKFKHLIEPFQLGSGDRACLLLHGFTGSPSEMRPLGEILEENDYTVYCPLLPGHGTSMDDLDKTKWKDWYEAAEIALKDILAKHEMVFVSGLSMGGALTLKLATQYPIRAIASIASGVVLDDWRITILPLLKFFKSRVKKTRNGFARGPERTRFAYEFNSATSTTQVVKLNRHLRTQLPLVKTPILLINSVHDRTIPFENMELISSLVSSTDKKLVALDCKNHILTLCDSKDRVNSEVLDFFNSH